MKIKKTKKTKENNIYHKTIVEEETTSNSIILRKSEDGNIHICITDNLQSKECVESKFYFMNIATLQFLIYLLHDENPMQIKYIIPKNCTSFIICEDLKDYNLIDKVKADVKFEKLSVKIPINKLNSKNLILNPKKTTTYSSCYLSHMYEDANEDEQFTIFKNSNHIYMIDKQAEYQNGSFFEDLYHNYLKLFHTGDNDLQPDRNINFYSCRKLIELTEKIFGNLYENKITDKIHIKTEILQDELKNKPDIELEKIRLYEYMLILEYLGHIKISDIAFYDKSTNTSIYPIGDGNNIDPVVEFNITFNKTPKEISQSFLKTEEKSEDIISWECLSINIKTAIVEYNGKEYQFAGQAKKQFPLLCLLAANPQEELTLSDIYQATTKKKSNWDKEYKLAIRAMLHKTAAKTNIPANIKTTLNRLKEKLGMNKPDSPLTIHICEKTIQLTYKIPTKLKK
jgi:hypothetical protein